MIGGGQMMDRDDRLYLEGATDPEWHLSSGCNKVDDTDNPAVVDVIAAMEKVI
jgi:hypothetical protein